MSLSAMMKTLNHLQTSKNIYRRNDVKILGLKEEKDETWKQSENLVVTKVRELLHIDEDLLMLHLQKTMNKHLRYVKNGLMLINLL